MSITNDRPNSYADVINTAFASVNNLITEIALGGDGFTPRYDKNAERVEYAEPRITSLRERLIKRGFIAQNGHVDSGAAAAVFLNICTQLRKQLPLKTRLIEWLSQVKELFGFGTGKGTWYTTEKFEKIRQIHGIIDGFKNQAAGRSQSAQTAPRVNRSLASIPE